MDKAQQWKTIIGLLALGLLALATTMGWIDRETAEPIALMLASITGVTWKLGANRQENLLKELVGHEREKAQHRGP